MSTFTHPTGKINIRARFGTGMDAPVISEFDKAHVDDIMAGDGDWFTAQLLRLCAKADSRNLERIRKGFPEVVETFEKWSRYE